MRMFAAIRVRSKDKVGSLRSMKRWFALHCSPVRLALRVLNNNTNAPTIHGFHLRMTLGACADA